MLSRHATQPGAARSCSALIDFAVNQAGRWRHPTPVNARGLGHVWRRHHILPQAALASGCQSFTSTSRASASILLGRNVREALANGQPIVALESTVITHGLPEPRNLELALELEEEISSGRWWRDNNHVDQANMQMRGQVVPATVGIIRGQLIVGLSREQIEFLARKELSRPIKASRRDLALAQAARLSAGTTVSATMAIASSLQLANNQHHHDKISVFATGGLGGVHLNGQDSLDISADLYEMARSPIGLVSSGFKSFLDTRRSLEFLETMGCTVTSLRPMDCEGAYQAANNLEQDLTTNYDERTNHLFPGFFTPTNRQLAKSPWQCHSVQEAARILFHCLGPGGLRSQMTPEGPPFVGGSLQNPRAMLLACPIPVKFSLKNDDEDAKMMDQITKQIEQQTELSGAQKTPLILAQLARSTGGRTLEANLALLRNNARIGAHLAHEYALLRAGNSIKRLEDSRRSTEAAVCRRGAPIVIGCTMIDMHVRTKVDDQFKQNARHSGVTFHGQPHLTLGGVGRNLAAAIELLGHKPLFLTSLASDNLAHFARLEMTKLGFNQNNENCSNSRMLICDSRAESSCFALVLIDSISGQCEYVIANLDSIEAITSDNLNQILLESSFEKTLEEQLKQCPLVVLDANLTGETLSYLIELCGRHQVPIFLEPTDVVCLDRLITTLRNIQESSHPGESQHSLAFLSPNVVELAELMRLFSLGDPKRGQPKGESNGFSLNEIEEMARNFMQLHMPHLKCLLVTMDKRGVLVAVRRPANEFVAGGSRTDLDQLKLLNSLQEVERHSDPVAVECKHYEPEQVIEQPISASGAGDCFAAGFMSGLIDGLTLKDCIQLGFKASACALRDRSTVPMSLKYLRTAD